MLGITDDADLDDDSSDLEKESADTNEENMQAGTLAAVQNVIRGMRDFPGRKSIVFVTAGFSLTSSRGQFEVIRPYLMEKFRRLVDESNRSFVTIHTLDMRGLVNPLMSNPRVGFSAEVRSAPRAGDLSALMQEHRNSQGGPMLLAEMGGGLSFAGNDYERGFQRALDDQEGYYVLGYQPETTTFQRSKGNAAAFHAIKVRVKRSGVSVRSRSGFFGVTDEESNPTPRTTEQVLWHAASSPFTATDLGVRVTPLFGHTPDGDLVKVLLHIDGDGLSFTKSEDGQYRAPMELLAMLVDGRGAAVEAKVYKFALRTAQPPDAAMLAAGFSASVDLNGVKPGAYQLRVAVRDVTSDRTGTGYQFVRIPNVATRRLSLSGIALRGDDANGHAALRRFHAASTLQYAFDTYNAGVDPANHHPSLTLRVRLYRDGALLLDGTPTPVDARPAEADPTRIATVTGRLQLSPTIPPGEYQMQLEVKDSRAAKPDAPAATAHQWIDFTIAGTP
jgi:hypothetical protein